MSRQNIHDPALGNDPALLRQLGIAVGAQGPVFAAEQPAGRARKRAGRGLEGVLGDSTTHEAQKPATGRQGSPLEIEFLALWRHLSGPELLREFEFHPHRRWRFDFCAPEKRFAVELEGLTHGQPGRHQTVKGMREDAEKYLSAWILGWSLVRLTRAQVTPEHLETIIRKLEK